MKKMIVSLFAATLFTHVGSFAQTTSKGEKETKGEKAEKKEITIEKKEGSKKEKIEIVIDGENVTINGKPANEYKSDERIVIDNDIIINRNSVMLPGQKDPVRMEWEADSMPILGVFTEKDDKGAKITRVYENTGAEKAGLKKEDIIIKINTTPISGPEELTEAIRNNKIGDEVNITYLRNGKTQKVKATLGKSNEVFVFNIDDFNFNFQNGKPYTFTMPRVPAVPPAPFWEGEIPGIQMYGSGTPKYGMSIQDDEDRRGVKVTGVDDESNAWKGGLREDDIITELDGEKITGVDDLKEKLATKKDNPIVSLKVLRGGKMENLTIKVPRKLKSGSL